MGLDETTSPDFGAGMLLSLDIDIDLVFNPTKHRYCRYNERVSYQLTWK